MKRPLSHLDGYEAVRKEYDSRSLPECIGVVERLKLDLLEELE